MHSSMPEEMKESAIDTTIKAIANNNDFSDISFEIANKFEQKYGENWQSIVGPKMKQFSYDIKYDLMIQFSINDVEVILFNSTTKSTIDLLNDARKQSTSPLVFKTSIF